MSKKDDVKEAFTLRHFTREESNTHMLVLLLALVAGGRGVSFLNLNALEIYENTWYLELHHVMDIRVWGVLLILFSVTLFLSLFIRTIMSTILTVASSMVIGVVFIFISGATFEFSQYLWSPYIHTVFAVIYIVYAGMGVYWRWIKNMQE